MSSLYTEHSVTKIKPAPNGVDFRLYLAPETVDPDRVYGAQETIVTFRRQPGGEPTPGVLGTEVYDGTIDDPSDPEIAMLTIDTIAMRKNRKLGQAVNALSTGIPYQPEGTLRVFAKDSDF